MERAEGTNPDAAVNALVDEYRHRCLWFLREDYYPATDRERLKVLDYIQRYGDSDAFRRAGEARRWYSPSCRKTSAAS